MADEIVLEEGKSEELEAEFVMQSDYEYLQGAINSVELLEQLDTAMMSQKHQRAARKAKRQGLDIIFHMIDTWHQELFDKDEEED